MKRIDPSMTMGSLQDPKPWFHSYFVCAMNTLSVTSALHQLSVGAGNGEPVSRDDATSGEHELGAWVDKSVNESHELLIPSTIMKVDDFGARRKHFGNRSNRDKAVISSDSLYDVEVKTKEDI